MGFKLEQLQRRRLAMAGQETDGSWGISPGWKRPGAARECPAAAITGHVIFTIQGLMTGGIHARRLKAVKIIRGGEIESVFRA
jgi:hypothetical protein